MWGGGCRLVFALLQSRSSLNQEQIKLGGDFYYEKRKKIGEKSREIERKVHVTKDDEAIIPFVRFSSSSSSSSSFLFVFLLLLVLLLLFLLLPLLLRRFHRLLLLLRPLFSSESKDTCDVPQTRHTHRSEKARQKPFSFDFKKWKHFQKGNGSAKSNQQEIESAPEPETNQKKKTNENESVANYCFFVFHSKFL